MTEVELIDGTTIDLNENMVVIGAETEVEGETAYKYLLATGDYIFTKTKIN